MSDAHAPTDAERKAFVQRLKQIRATLNPDEQRMLDALVETARRAHAQGDVQVYWMDGAWNNPGYPSTNPPGTDLTIGTPGSAWWQVT